MDGREYEKVDFKDLTMGLDGLKRQVLKRTGRCSQSSVTLAMAKEVLSKGFLQL